jgi:hypothetical protein
LEQEIKEIEEDLEDEFDKNNPKPGDKKKEGKFTYLFLVPNGYHLFESILSGQKEVSIKINKNHPEIKRLISEGKLQKDKNFIIRYGKVDKISEVGLVYIFNENNQGLEIVEV